MAVRSASVLSQRCHVHNQIPNRRTVRLKLIYSYVSITSQFKKENRKCQLLLFSLVFCLGGAAH